MLSSEQPSFGLKRLVGRILQDDGTDDERTQRDRLALYLILGVPVVALFLVHDIILGSYISAGIISLSLGLLIASIWMLWRNTDLVTPTRLFMLAVCWILGTSHFWDGQYASMSLWLIPVIPMCAAFIQGVRAAFVYLLVTVGILVIAMFSSLHVETTQWIENTEIHCLFLRMAGMVFFGASGLLSRHVTQNQRRLLGEQQTEVERVKSEHDAAAASKSLFFANFSHEIRTPMNGILGMTQHLLGQALPHKVRESVGLMHSCAEELLGLLNQILDLSALEVHQRDKELLPLSLRQATTECAETLTKGGKTKAVEFDKESDDELSVIADDEVLSKTLTSILEYAASQAIEGRVQVRFLKSAQSSGESYVEALFGYRTEASDQDLEDKDPGSLHGEHKSVTAGVALSIAEQLAKLMDATLHIQPPTQDGQACIKLRFSGQSTSHLQLTSPTSYAHTLHTALSWSVAKIKDFVKDSSRCDRSKVLAGIHLVIAPATLGYSIYAYAQGYRLGFILHAVAVPLFLASAWINYKNRHTPLAAWLTVAGAFSVVALQNFADGQIRSESLWLLPLLPVGTLFILSHRAFIGIFIACSVFLIGVFLGSQQIQLPQEYQESFSYLLMMRLVSLQLFAGMCILAVYASERLSERYTKRRVAMLKALKNSERAHEEKSIFLTNMSHEIRTPMNGILGLTESLIDQDLPHNQQQAIQTIHRCGGHLLALLGDVFDTSELHGGKQGISKIPMCLHEVVNDVVFLFDAKAKLKGVRLHASGAGEQLQVMGDRTRLMQVLSNLVGNAVKFSDQGSVEVALLEAIATPRGQKPGYQVVLEVRDQGIGIAESRLELLFHSFVQVDATHGEDRGGTGLGLAISRRLIRAMGGELKVESTQGAGSVFRVELWLESAAPSVSPPVIPVRVPEKTKTPKSREILVVDDNAINLRVAVASLQRLGYQAYTAPGGEAAIELARQRHFDAILMDVRMPGIDGLQATRAIRESAGPCKEVPIMALTAESYETQIQLCLESGMNGHLAKPFRSEDLQERLAELWALCEHPDRVA